MTILTNDIVVGKLWFSVRLDTSHTSRCQFNLSALSAAFYGRFVSTGVHCYFKFRSDNFRRRRFSVELLGMYTIIIRPPYIPPFVNIMQYFFIFAQRSSRRGRRTGKFENYFSDRSFGRMSQFVSERKFSEQIPGPCTIHSKTSAGFSIGSINNEIHCPGGIRRCRWWKKN